MSNIKVPCPTCVLRGPVWLDANRKCVYCGRTWANPDVSIWSMVPLEWWLEEGMIDEAEIPVPQGEATPVNCRGQGDQAQRAAERM